MGEKAIVVGASQKNDARWEPSNYGKCVDIFAPGRDITSASHKSNTATARMSGTSMAAPHVSGAVALVLQRMPHGRYHYVSSVLYSNANKNMLSNVGELSSNRLLFVAGPDFKQRPPTPTSAPTSPTPAPTSTSATAPTASPTTASPTASPTAAPTSAPTPVPTFTFQAYCEEWGGMVTCSSDGTAAFGLTVCDLDCSTQFCLRSNPYTKRLWDSEGPCGNSCASFFATSVPSHELEFAQLSHQDQVEFCVACENWFSMGKHWDTYKLARDQCVQAGLALECVKPSFHSTCLRPR